MVFVGTFEVVPCTRTGQRTEPNSIWRKSRHFRRQALNPLRAPKLTVDRQGSVTATLQLAFLIDELLVSMHSSTSFHEATNAFAPSSCNWAARASMSIPPLLNCFRVDSQSPPSGGRIDPRSCFSRILTLLSQRLWCRKLPVPDF